MGTEDIQSDNNQISEAEKGSRLASILAAIHTDEEEIDEVVGAVADAAVEEEVVEEVPPEPVPDLSTQKLEEVLQSTEKIRGASKRTVAVSSVGPEQESFLAEVITQIDSLRDPLKETLAEYPVLSIHLTILNKLVSEYHRLDNQIDDYMQVITEMTGIKLTGERSRVRDNLTQLVIERWRLLNSLLDNVNKLHGNIMKTRPKGDDKSDEDLFASYARYAEGDTE